MPGQGGPLATMVYDRAYVWILTCFTATIKNFFNSRVLMG